MLDLEDYKIIDEKYFELIDYGEEWLEEYTGQPSYLERKESLKLEWG